MAKPELGTKRGCLSCGAKYYDLMRDPIVCPKCGAVFEVAAQEKVAAEPEDERADEVEDAGDAAPVVAGAEVVSLSEVAEDDAGDDDDDDKKPSGTEDIPEIEDVELDDAESDDDAFLDDDEEDGGDVSDILGDVPGDDEEG